jgi:hypothetical protein
LSPEFKGNPEYATWNVLYHTNLRNYASFRLQVPSILSILLVFIFPWWGEGGRGEILTNCAEKALSWHLASPPYIFLHFKLLLLNFVRA